MPPMRVLQVVSYMGQGGIENLLMSLYRNIDRERVQFDFLVHTDQKQCFDGEIERLGGKIYRLPRLKYWQIPALTKNYDRFFLEHPEYKIVHSHINTWSTWVLRSAKKAGVPTRIAHAHISKPAFSLLALLKQISRWGLPWYATDYFACSRLAAQWVFGRKADQAVIFRNGVKTGLFQFNSQKRQRVREELSCQDPLVIGHVGRFGTQKNHAFLIDIFAALKKSHPDAVLVLVGDGILRGEIEKKVAGLNLSDSVRFLGVRSDIPDILSACDAFVFPSFYEGLGIVAIEAQANGLPTIISESVPHEVVATDLVRFVSLKQSAKEWADGILEEIAKKRDLREDYVKQVKESGYDIGDCIEWLTDFYLTRWEKVAKEENHE